jgi:hypothetical protein
MLSVRTVLAAIAAAVALSSAAPAGAVDLQNLTGWWIAIDDTFPTLWQRGDVTAVEEVLIINPDGRIENRVMNFWSGDPESCAKMKVCSDLPVIATARVAVKGDNVAVSERKSRSERIDSARTDARIRQVAVTAAPAWTVSLSGKSVMTVRAGATTRTFARIEPDRLRRLRAGMRISGLPASKHWRCFLAVGTARNAAFASLRDEPVTVPDFFEQYLRAASYVAVLDSLIKRPTADDRDPKARDLIAYEPEELMAEHFDGLTVPARLSDKQRLQVLAAAIAHRVRPKTAADPGHNTSALALDVPLKISLSNAEIAALTRAASNDPDAKKMFCRD